MNKLNAAMRNFLFCVSTILALAVGQSIYAQNASQSADRANMSRDQVNTAPGPVVTTTGSDNDHIVASPNDADLGEQEILKRNEGYLPFSASVGVPFYWTSNVALTNQGEQSDFLVSPVAAIAYQPKINQNLYGLVSVREQLFYYDRLTSFDFGSFDVEIGLTYSIPQLHNLMLHIEYDYNRLTKKNSFDDFFQDHLLTMTAEMPFRIDRAQQISIGMNVNISMAGVPEPPRRDDFEWYAGYSVQLTRALVLSASGRIILHDYVLTDRLDVNEIVGLNLSYAITRFLSASALASFAANQSNHSTFDYQVVNGGGAVSFSIRF